MFYLYIHFIFYINYTTHQQKLAIATPWLILLPGHGAKLWGAVFEPRQELRLRRGGFTEISPQNLRGFPGGD